MWNVDPEIRLRPQPSIHMHASSPGHTSDQHRQHLQAEEDDRAYDRIHHLTISGFWGQFQVSEKVILQKHTRKPNYTIVQL